MKKVNLKVGRNVFLYRDTDGSEVMVEVWAQQEDHPIGAGALYIESIDVATRPEAGDVWGPPLSAERV